GIQNGTLGRVAAGKAPLFDHGALIGEVSVGFPVERAAGQLADMLRSFAAYLALALAVGVAGAAGFARWLKRQTFGLELREIAGLLEVLPPGRLGDIACGEISGPDLLVLSGDRLLVANRMPIRLVHRHLGWVVTFHDRTEPESLKRD